MSAELHADHEAARPPIALDETVPSSEAPAHGRPKAFGDLPTVLDAAPMFRRAPLGYDRFQVDTYVRWAEDELAAAAREREHLVEEHLRTRAALEDAQELISHSAAGADFLGLSRRIGPMLAAAADEAEAIRAEGEAARAAARAQAAETVAHAEGVLADALTQAQRTLAEADADAQASRTEAARILAAAERTRAKARAQAEAQLEKARALEQRALEQAEQIRLRAAEDAALAGLQARNDVVQMLVTGREERRRADAEAAATRRRLDRDAAARRVALLAEIEELERRRAVLNAEQHGAEPATTASRPTHPHLRGAILRIRGRHGTRLTA